MGAAPGGAVQRIEVLQPSEVQRVERLHPESVQRVEHLTVDEAQRVMAAPAPEPKPAGPVRSVLGFGGKVVVFTMSMGLAVAGMLWPLFV